MSPLRLCAAAMLVAALPAGAAQPARAVGATSSAMPAICSEGAGALTMDLYNIAVESLNECLSLQNLSARHRVIALSQRGHAHAALDAYDRAIGDYDEALEIGGPDVELLIARGSAHFYDDDNDAALADFDRVIALDPENPEAAYFRGLVYTELSEHHEAVVAHTFSS